MKVFGFSALRLSVMAWLVVWLAATNHCALDSCFGERPSAASASDAGCDSHGESDSSGHSTGEPCGIVQSVESAPLKVDLSLPAAFIPVIDFNRTPTLTGKGVRVSLVYTSQSISVDRFLASLSIASNAPPVLRG